MNGKRTKRTRAYGLFEKRENGWVRICPSFYGSKDYMVRICQDALLAYAFGVSKYPRELRPIGNLADLREAEWNRMLQESAALATASV